jgi:DNA-binding MarR family transcriptional regulator
MKKVQVSLTLEQANLVEDVLSSRMIRIYDGATDEERAELEKTYKALNAVVMEIALATARVSA